MKNIINIVDRKRWGLVEHAHAVDYFARSLGVTSTTYSVLDSDGLRLKTLLSKKNSTIIIWSLGICTLFIPFLRLRNKIIFVCHEPGGVRQRYRKNDGLFYSIYVSLYELMMSFSHHIATPNKDNAEKYGMQYLPLLYKPISSFESVRVSTESRYCIYYLGRVDDRRGADIFSRLQRELSDKYDFKFFPFEGIGCSEQDKVTYTRQNGCVFNYYKVRHNQSGVTGDALRLNMPAIVSNFDFISKDIESHGIGKVIDCNVVDLNEFSTAIEELASITYTDEISSYYNDNFGERAFEKFWYEII